MSDLLIFWLPIIGTAIFLPLAMTEGYAGRRRRAIGLGAVGVVCLILVGYLQWVAPVKDRPWISVEHFRMLPVVLGNSLETQVVVVNRGNQPALNVRTGSGGIIVPKGDRIPDSFLRLPENARSRGVMMPGATYYLAPVNSDQAYRNEADVQLIATGQWVPWITGRVEYEDANGNHYFTMFRAFYDYRSRVYIFADSGNDAS